MSMLFYGPPGTSKTTLAYKIAAEIGWPLLELSQGHFLHEGLGGLDAEAERIFAILEHLKDTVVLFDEIEEMVTSRPGAEKSGRFLTTSMLPRLHHLRDLGQVVFIMATNYVGSIDEAAIRLGRIDIIQEVGYPTVEEIQEMLQTAISLLCPDDALAGLLTSAFADQAQDDAKALLGMTFVHIKDFVRRCVILKMKGEENVTARIGMMLTGLCHQVGDEMKKRHIDGSLPRRP